MAHDDEASLDALSLHTGDEIPLQGTGPFESDGFDDDEDDEEEEEDIVEFLENVVRRNKDANMRHVAKLLRRLALALEDDVDRRATAEEAAGNTDIAAVQPPANPVPPGDGAPPVAAAAAAPAPGAAAEPPEPEGSLLSRTHDDWQRLARILHTELTRGNNQYAASLDFRARGSFERLARLVKRVEPLVDFIEETLRMGTAETEAEQVVCYVAFLVCEGTREELADDGSSVQDLLPYTDVNPPVRRLPALSWLQTLLDHNGDGVIAELIQAGVHRKWIQRLHELADSIRIEGDGKSASKRPRDGDDEPPQAADNDDDGDAVNNDAPDPAAPTRWAPAAGDRVVRGPSWQRGEQDLGSSHGTVVALHGPEVVVRWDADSPADAAGGPPGSQRRHRSHTTGLFRYSFGEAGGHREVLAEALSERQERLVVAEDLDVVFEETIVLLGLLSTVCVTAQTVLPLLQHKTITLLLRLMRHRSHAMVSRTLWLLNAVVAHRKCCVQFLEEDGPTAVFAAYNGATLVSIQYGCSLVLSRLSAVPVLAHILQHRRDVVTQLVALHTRHLRHEQADVQGTALSFFGAALTIPSVHALFAAGDGLAGVLDIMRRLRAKIEDITEASRYTLLTGALRVLSAFSLTHFLLAVRPLFARHKRLAVPLHRSADHALPQDQRTLDLVLAALARPARELLDAAQLDTAGAAADQPALLALSSDAFAYAVPMSGLGVATELLALLEFSQRSLRWDLAGHVLSALRLLFVCPTTRSATATLEAPPPEPSDTARPTAVAILLGLVSDFTPTLRDGGTATLRALESLEWVLAPAADNDSAAREATCALIRLSDGVRILLHQLRSLSAASVSSAPDSPTELDIRFRVAMRIVHCLSALAGMDTMRHLLAQLGVPALATEALRYFSGALPSTQLRAQFAGSVHALLADLDPAGPLALGEAAGPSGALPEPSMRSSVAPFDPARPEPPGPPRRLVLDPFEDAARVAIASKSHVAYSEASLLDVLAEDLAHRGLRDTAATLRREAQLPLSCPVAPGTPSALDGLLKTYLRQQHAACEAPIAFLPEASLRQPHRCPPPPPPYTVHTNLLSRLWTRKVDFLGWPAARAEQQRYLHGHFRQVFDVRGSEEGLVAECVTFLDDGSLFAVGTTDGAIATFNVGVDTVSEQIVEQHRMWEDEAVYDIMPSPDSSVLALVRAHGDMAMCPRHQLPTIHHTLHNCKAIDYAHDNTQWLATDYDVAVQCATVYDAETFAVVAKYGDPPHSRRTGNQRNVARFNSTSSLIVNDAVLWDVRCGGRAPVCRFDKLTTSCSNVFHPLDDVVIVDKSVWDLRTRRVIASCPALADAVPHFVGPRDSPVIYASVDFPQGSYLHVVDSADYTVISQTNLKQRLEAFCIDPHATHFAGIVDTVTEDTVVKVFAIGVESRDVRGAGPGDTGAEDAADDSVSDATSRGSLHDEDLLGSLDGEDDGLDDLDDDSDLSGSVSRDSRTVSDGTDSAGPGGESFDDIDEDDDEEFDDFEEEEEAPDSDQSTDDDDDDDDDSDEDAPRSSPLRQRHRYAGARDGHAAT